MKDEISTIKGVFVFAATIIGAGILALPVAAAKTGFSPMLLILLVVAADRSQKMLSPSATLLVVIPPLVIALFKPKAFANALDIAGTYGGGMFVGILPVLMVLSSRKKIKTIKHITWGGQCVPYIVLSIYLIGMCYGTMKILS
jgi:amino acid permease